ncbi:diacylglucosamine hydrolase like protein [Campylobacter sp. LR291e]|uniref:epoxyqueuosine reductase QueH n=1 Tax=unclassified Campylobacter TaxID=2593542 RepID=UPI00123ABDFC|nr:MULTISPECIES: epoxyqueuosine reductase QueH [unclassified Campylobacter]KAA6225179.1 diacylglucosamine hydrolase like protein [Campylobacter sp. LR196d]KAA6231392.1 diacylglucosamine hydrolase like protein [Campylobacter sp. LR264d]KAA6231604.1 diacylglucosamine hydrolase like protein [Campylobacter sp. LR291e]
MLVHICCSVDSHFFISELKKAYPNENLIGFFYDPNIHPYSEYELRFLDVKRSCDKLNIKLYKGEYDYELWLNLVKGLENEPEKGKRCNVCFDIRIQKSAQFAKKIGEKKLTTTLLTSPKKDFTQLENVLKKECKPYNIEVIAPDFRKNGGTQRQFALAKKERLYHQNYCGCLYALSKQKENKNFIAEFISPINKQILPASIEEKKNFYKKLNNLEKKGVNFELVREKFLNYRLLFGLVKFNKKPVKTHILFYSHFKNSYTKFALNDDIKGIYRSLKDELVLLDFNFLNALCKNKFKDFNDFLKRSLSIKQEILLRKKLFDDYNLSGVIIFEELKKGSYEFICRNEIYFDTREKIIKIN